MAKERNFLGFPDIQVLLAFKKYCQGIFCFRFNKTDFIFSCLENKCIIKLQWIFFGFATDLNKDAQVQYGLPQVRPWPSDHPAVLPAARGRQVQPGADVSSGSKLDGEWTGLVDIVGLDNSQMV